MVATDRVRALFADARDLQADALEMLEPGKNVRWEITIQPSSDADVTIVLPVTTDCTAQGAICKSDERKLSSRVELTISGPRE